MKAYYEYGIVIGNDLDSNCGGVVKESVEECIKYCEKLLIQKYCKGNQDKFDDFVKSQDNLWVSITTKVELFSGYIDDDTIDIENVKLKSLINIYAVDYQYDFKEKKMHRYEITKYKDCTIYGNGRELEDYYDAAGTKFKEGEKVYYKLDGKRGVIVGAPKFKTDSWVNAYAIEMDNYINDLCPEREIVRLLEENE